MDIPRSLRHMASATLDLQLPSRPQSITSRPRLHRSTSLTIEAEAGVTIYGQCWGLVKLAHCTHSPSLIVHHTRLSAIGDWAFPVTTARVRNSLPQHAVSSGRLFHSFGQAEATDCSPEWQSWILLFLHWWSRCPVLSSDEVDLLRCSSSVDFFWYLLSKK